MKIALVLGGGGARGLAHLGVLRVLEREKIKFHFIVGCSFGAIVGGMYAQTPQVELVEKRFRNFVHTRAFQELGFHLMKKRKIDEDLYFKQLAHNIRNRVLINLVINKLAVLKEGRLKNAIAYLLKPGNIEDTHIPFACNATDLISGRPYLFTHGDIRKAVQASSAIPGIFPPLKLNGKLFSDGAIIFNIPVPFARALGADYVIAVDVHPTLEPDNNITNVFDVFLRASNITGTYLSEKIIEEADLVVRPEVGHFHWSDFEHAEKIVEKGEQAMEAALETFRRDVGTGRMGPLRRLFRANRTAQ